MSVTEIFSQEQFNQHLQQAGHKPVFIDFFATWCGPCVMIKPVFEELSEKYKDQAIFIKVDVDQMEQLSAYFGITAMPTFICVKHGQKVGVMKGADISGLRDFVEKNLQLKA